MIVMTVPTRSAVLSMRLGGSCRGSRRSANGRKHIGVLPSHYFRANLTQPPLQAEFDRSLFQLGGT
jgi:hypothetical protein